MTDSGHQQRPKGSGSLFFSADRGLWVAVAELPAVDGRRHRKRVCSKSEETARSALALMIEQIDADKAARKLAAVREAVAATDLPWTVETWSAHWLRVIARRRVKPMTFSGYEAAFSHHINPIIGGVPLSTVGPKILRLVETSMVDGKGLSPSTALLTFRVMSVCFGDAVREEAMERNPAERMHSPKKAVPALSTLTPADCRMLLREIARRPDGAMWAMSLLTGARRGEVLGLELDRVGEVLEVSRQLQRFAWKHGCLSDPSADPYCRYGRGAECRHRYVDLPPGFEHRHAYGSLFLTRPKSTAGFRLVPLVEPLRSLLITHIRSRPVPANGLVFTNSKGNPVDPDAMTRDWDRLRAEVGIRKSGASEDLIMEIIGHSSVNMTRGYKSRASDDRRRGALVRMAEFLS